ncbi:MAG TPA: protein phosphatase 2C domain-containing protein [Longimicrobiales bacterium]|nr:protein phosphatase 2C domain-containing protein [Longimicrobiales bacterium]
MALAPSLAVESIAGLRPYQEDSVIAETLPDGRTLVAVADGMGGHAAGEVASSVALETLVGALEEGHGLGEAFRLANERVHRMASEPGKRGMGTTLTAVLVEGEAYTVANVGDSRVYLVSAEGVRRLTEDHSFVAEAVRRGQSEEEAMATPWRDALTRSIGTEEEVEIDLFGPFPLEEDSALLLCSDGLYKALSDEELHQVFVQSRGARGAARSLVTAAFDGGSDDNISVAIAEYGEVPRTRPAPTMILSYPVDDADVDGESAYDAAGAVTAADAGRIKPALSLPAITFVGFLIAAALVAAFLTFGG